ncbi:MAG: DNA sulfur modification protein DndE [Deltaproteobacteria bacterium]|jgi:DNA sulfur modification protein DndE|nr:DNA sulfur modification protein DndE [Deltaproteobacteria bacterium]
MPELGLHRIPFTTEADNRLRSLKAKTGMTANILCRIGFCLSLEEQGIPSELPERFTQDKEINRYTLLGKYDTIYIALLITRILEDNLSLKLIDNMFLAHLHRGIEILSSRIKTIGDFGELI